MPTYKVTQPNGKRTPKRKGNAKLGSRMGNRVPANWRHIFLNALVRCPNITAACAAAKISRWFAYQQIERSATFRKQVEDATKAGVETGEAKLWEVGFVGERDPVWMKDANGEPVKVDEVKKVNVTAAIFLLKAHAPHKYRESYSITGPGGGPVQHEFTVNLTAAELGALAPKKLDGAVEVEADVKLEVNGHEEGNGS